MGAACTDTVSANSISALWQQVLGEAGGTFPLPVPLFKDPPVTDKLQRRLTAILILDVSGFRCMIAEGEAGTLNQVPARQQSLIAPAIASPNSRGVPESVRN